MHRPLSDLERSILEFAGTSWRSKGLQEQEIRRRFDLSATRYWQLVNGLLDRPEHSPMTVRRLQRLRDQCAAARSARALI
ncbi:MAG: DUF3263 domain-containing protein [Candidatus Nanopelagicales bacterium]